MRLRRLARLRRRPRARGGRADRLRRARRQRPCGRRGRAIAFAGPSAIAHADVEAGPFAFAEPPASANAHAPVEAGARAFAGLAVNAHAYVEAGPLAFAGWRASANAHADVRLGDRLRRLARRGRRGWGARLSPARPPSHTRTSRLGRSPSPGRALPPSPMRTRGWAVRLRRAVRRRLPRAPRSSRVARLILIFGSRQGASQ